MQSYILRYNRLKTQNLKLSWIRSKSGGGRETCRYTFNYNRFKIQNFKQSWILNNGGFLCQQYSSAMLCFGLKYKDNLCPLTTCRRALVLRSKTLPSEFLATFRPSLISPATEHGIHRPVSLHSQHVGPWPARVPTSGINDERKTPRIEVQTADAS